MLSVALPFSDPKHVASSTQASFSSFVQKGAIVHLIALGCIHVFIMGSYV